MALSWSARRQVMIVGGFLAGLLVIAAIIIIPKLSVQPTCSDGKQNGNELGVDCGGGCKKLCLFQAQDPIVKWARVFPVTSTVSSALAYIQNPNPTAAAENVPYQFKIYDADRQFIAERDGMTSIAPNGASAIFEGGIQTGARVPAYAQFQFTAPPEWVSLDPRIITIQLIPNTPRMENAATLPKLSGSVTNTSGLYAVQDIYTVAIAYDANGNAVGVSQTYLPGLNPGQSSSVYFTWPAPFQAPSVRYELIPKFNVFSVKFQ